MLVFQYYDIFLIRTDSIRAIRTIQQGSHSLDLKNSRTFLGPQKHFSRPYRKPAMLTVACHILHFSTVKCIAPAKTMHNNRIHLPKCTAIPECTIWNRCAWMRIYWHEQSASASWCPHPHHCLANSRTFQDQTYFLGLSRSWKFYKKNLRTFREAWEP